jgi:hypothetical protein
MMSDPFSDPEFVVSMERRQADLDMETLRWIAFREGVRDMPGLLGQVFRAVGYAHDGYEEARTQYATTEGEPQRWTPVVEETVALWEYLRDGGTL